MTFKTGNQVIKALVDAGIIGPNVRRCVIDLTVGEIAVIHVEEYADERLLTVTEALVGVKIKRARPRDPS